MQNLFRKRRGFTLIELLVVIGIIAVLAGLLLPMLVKAMRAGRRSRTASDLNSIAIGLEAYRTDFGDYPRLPPAPLAGSSGSAFGLLGFALIGPGPEVGTTSMNTAGPSYNAGVINVTGTSSNFVQLIALKNTNTAPSAGSDWGPFGYFDGADGPGFRTVNNTTLPNSTIKSKVFGPYLDPGKFKLQGLSILDSDGHPILYFPARPGKLNLGATFDSTHPVYYVASQSSVAASPVPAIMYNLDDCGTLACSMVAEYQINSTTDFNKTVARMQVMLGAVKNVGTANAGQLAPGETPATTAPFLLWSTGADGFFGPREDILQLGTDATSIHKAINSCDDVTNFTFAQ